MYIYALIQNPRIIYIYNLLFTVLIEIFFAYPPFFSAEFLCTVLNPISVLELFLSPWNDYSLFELGSRIRLTFRINICSLALYAK